MTLNENQQEDLEFFRNEMESDLARLTEIKAIEDPEEQFSRLSMYYLTQYIAARLVGVNE